MKFGQQFEFQKIPEWYTMYLKYEFFKQLISAFKDKVKAGQMVKLTQTWRFQKVGDENTWNLFNEDNSPEAGRGSSGAFNSNR